MTSSVLIPLLFTLRTKDCSKPITLIQLLICWIASSLMLAICIDSRSEVSIFFAWLMIIATFALSLYIFKQDFNWIGEYILDFIHKNRLKFAIFFITIFIIIVVLFIGDYCFTPDTSSPVSSINTGRSRFAITKDEPIAKKNRLAIKEDIPIDSNSSVIWDQAEKMLTK